MLAAGLSADRFAVFCLWLWQTLDLAAMGGVEARVVLSHSTHNQWVTLSYSH